MNEANAVATIEPKEMRPVVSNSDTPDSALAIVGRMVASGAQKETIEQMVSLIEWDDKRKAKMAFNSAFALAKGKFKQARKSGDNKHLKSRYSLLEDYDDASRDALSAHGLSWRHVPSMDGNVLSVRCILAHQAGHSEEAELHAPADGMTNSAVNKLQSAGIVLMYLKRMTLASMLGLVSDSDFDNDGNGGVTVERITETQAADLQCLLDEVYSADEIQSQRDGLLRYLSKAGKVTISSISDIPSNMYTQAVNVVKSVAKTKGSK